MYAGMRHFILLPGNGEQSKKMQDQADCFWGATTTKEKIKLYSISPAMQPGY